MALVKWRRRYCPSEKETSATVKSGARPCRVLEEESNEVAKLTCGRIISVRQYCLGLTVGVRQFVLK